MKKSCVVLGGGGHAKVVVETLLNEGKCRPMGVTDPRISEGKLLGVPYVGDDEVLPKLLKKGVRAFVVGLAGVPDNRPRAALFQKGKEAGMVPVTTVHPKAVVAKSATLGAGTVVFPRAVVNPDCVLGQNVIVNTGAVVEHDVRIADHAHVCPGTVLCGGVEVGEGAFVGAGAVVTQGVRIGAWAVIGAGSTVRKDVPEGGRVAGVPAIPI
jgi:UDP-perosamine 4-acetyltransferase